MGARAHLSFPRWASKLLRRRLKQCIGTLTALMGVSGAGKTTLLNCLADRIAIGMVSGQVFVDGRPRDVSFQRKTGYAQQQVCL